tara:strand:+ start:2883 stop:4190 length:1308 start_codon:yes stop_codon:yes gene_type:complete
MIIKISLVLLGVISQAFGLSLSDYSPYEYKVLFTNPECKLYEYEEPVYSNDGTLLTSKPKNVYCKKSDFELNSERADSPHYELKELISDKGLKSLFFAFLSFSNDEIANQICDAIKRNVAVTFIIDSNSEARPSSRKALDFIAGCTPENLSEGETPNIPKTYFRGNDSGIGYAHNKVIIANYDDPNKVRLVYGSGNMSSGTILHHENWHFVTTSSKSFLAQSHVCLQKAMLDAGNSKSEYKKVFKTCRSSISAPVEDDIEMMVVPSDGQRAMKNIVDNFKKAVSVDVAVHRFTHPDLINAMVEASEQDKLVRFVADDDIYWTGVRKKMTGSNMFFEFVNAMKVVKSGVETRYIQSNQNHRLLHHNKFVLYHYPDGTGSVHAGAGNFTKAAFTKNMENYYFITIPEVVEAFKKQFDHKFSNLATPYEKMPATYVMP